MLPRRPVASCRDWSRLRPAREPVRAAPRLRLLGLVCFLLIFGTGALCPKWAEAAEPVRVRIRLELTPAQTPGATLRVFEGKLLGVKSLGPADDDPADLTLDLERGRAKLSRQTPRARDGLELTLDPTGDLVLRTEWHTSEANRDAETVEVRLADLTRQKTVELLGKRLRLTIEPATAATPKAVPPETAPSENNLDTDPDDEPLAEPARLLTSRRHLVFAPGERLDLLYRAPRPTGPDATPDTTQGEAALQWSLHHRSTGERLAYDYEPLVAEDSSQNAALTAAVTIPMPRAEGLYDCRLFLDPPGPPAPLLLAEVTLAVVDATTPLPIQPPGDAPIDTFDPDHTGLWRAFTAKSSTNRLDKAVQRVTRLTQREAASRDTTSRDQADDHTTVTTAPPPPAPFRFRTDQPGRLHRLDLAGRPAEPPLPALFLWPESRDLRITLPPELLAASAKLPSASLWQPGVEPIAGPSDPRRLWGLIVDRPTELGGLIALDGVARTPPQSADDWFLTVDRLIETLLARHENGLIIRVNDDVLPLWMPQPKGLSPPGTGAADIDLADLVIDPLELLLRKCQRAGISVIPAVHLARNDAPRNADGKPPHALSPTTHAATRRLLADLRTTYRARPTLAGIALVIDGQSVWEFHSPDEGFAQLQGEFAQSRPQTASPIRTAAGTATGPAPVRPIPSQSSSRDAKNSPGGSAAYVTPVSASDPAWIDYRAARLADWYHRLAQDLTRDWPTGRLFLDIRTPLPTLPLDAPGRAPTNSLLARGLLPRPPLAPQSTQRPPAWLFDAQSWDLLQGDPLPPDPRVLLGWIEPPASAPHISLREPPPSLSRSLAATDFQFVFHTGDPLFASRDPAWNLLREPLRSLPLATPGTAVTSHGQSGIAVRSIATPDGITLFALNTTRLAVDLELTLTGCPASTATRLSGPASLEPLPLPADKATSHAVARITLPPSQLWIRPLDSRTVRLDSARIHWPEPELARLSRELDALQSRLGQLESAVRSASTEPTGADSTAVHAADEYRTLTRAYASAHRAWREGRYADCDRLLAEQAPPAATPSRPSEPTADRSWLTPWRK
jgi:hypothetical protein